MSHLANAIRERQSRRSAQALRRSVAELSADLKRAMLAATEAEELIVGAYTDRRGRMCPMLAAHRRGARLDAGRFPRAWDAFARARRPRPATRREVDVLRALLQESLADWGDAGHQQRGRVKEEAGSGAPA